MAHFQQKPDKKMFPLENYNDTVVKLRAKRVIFGIKQALKQHGFEDINGLRKGVEEKVGVSDTAVGFEAMEEMRKELKESVRIAIETGDATGFMGCMKKETFNIWKREIFISIGEELKEREQLKKLASGLDEDERFGETVKAMEVLKVHEEEAHPEPPVPSKIPKLEVANLREENSSESSLSLQSGDEIPSPEVLAARKEMKKQQNAGNTLAEQFESKKKTSPKRFIRSRPIVKAATSVSCQTEQKIDVCSTSVQTEEQKIPYLVESSDGEFDRKMERRTQQFNKQVESIKTALKEIDLGSVRRIPKVHDVDSDPTDVEEIETISARGLL